MSTKNFSCTNRFGDSTLLNFRFYLFTLRPNEKREHLSWTRGWSGVSIGRMATPGVLIPSKLSTSTVVPHGFLSWTDVLSDVP